LPTLAMFSAIWAAALSVMSYQGGLTSVFHIAALGMLLFDVLLGGAVISGLFNKQIKKETVRSKYIVNAAGLGADKVASLVGVNDFKIKPRMGEYLLFNKSEGKHAKHILFPTPGKYGKGVLVQPTLWGNLLLGPTARDMHNPDHVAKTPTTILKEIITSCRRLIPSFNAEMVIHSFAGARAKSDRGDWIVEASKVGGFILAAGIDSPGVAGSPAISKEVVKLLQEAGLETEADPLFNPYRRPIIVPKKGWSGIKIDHEDPKKNVVCKCEKVTEAEVVDAVNRSLIVDSSQAVRKRTRAGMGHCQGQFCEPRVKKIIAREKKISLGKVGGRPWPASSLLPQRWLTESQKGDLKKMA